MKQVNIGLQGNSICPAKQFRLNFLVIPAIGPDHHKQVLCILENRHQLFGLFDDSIKLKLSDKAIQFTQAKTKIIVDVFPRTVTETFTIVYTTYDPDYHTFYQRALQDMEKAKETREYGLDAANHPNWFDASCIPWISFDSLTIELPDGYLYFNPIINWGRYCEENGKMMMPVSVRMNHAVADGYLVARVFVLMEQEMKALCEG